MKVKVKDIKGGEIIIDKKMIADCKSGVKFWLKIIKSKTGKENSKKDQKDWLKEARKNIRYYKHLIKEYNKLKPKTKKA